MSDSTLERLYPGLPQIPADRPVLIAGPTASGKSKLALELARTQGGLIVNADASQVYNCWRILTDRPGPREEARASHALFGHRPFDAVYSVGRWLREVTPLLSGAQRPIIVGGTGLYFTALTEGLTEIPAIPPEIRARADRLPLQTLRDGLDIRTSERIDLANRPRVQRAWEVLQGTGRPLADWQDDTPPPVLPIADTVPLLLNPDRHRLSLRIGRRTAWMIAHGALEEAVAMRDRYDPALPSCKAIGVAELMAHFQDGLTLDAARKAIVASTLRYAKRQRTWLRSRMPTWRNVTPCR